jgi:hypothetical protein
MKRYTKYLVIAFVIGILTWLAISPADGIISFFAWFVILIGLDAFFRFIFKKRKN